MDEQEDDSGEFDLNSVRFDGLYPPDALLVELGRSTIAATRTDAELALVLEALKSYERYDTLTKKPSKLLNEEARKRVRKFFEGDLETAALEILAYARTASEERNELVHSIWKPAAHGEMIPVAELMAVRSQDDLNALIRRRGDSSGWHTHHARSGRRQPAPDLQSVIEVRQRLEYAELLLTRLRFTLASALFAGTPPGAREVLDPDALEAQREACPGLLIDPRAEPL